ncbi:MAG: toprim domain-containing protein [bacterium]
MDLIIIESPHKAITILSILGSKYIKASVGHIRDLAKDNISVNDIKINPENRIRYLKLKPSGINNLRISKNISAV